MQSCSVVHNAIVPIPEFRPVLRAARLEDEEDKKIKGWITFRFQFLCFNWSDFHFDFWVTNAVTIYNYHTHLMILIQRSEAMEKMGCLGCEHEWGPSCLYHTHLSHVVCRGWRCTWTLSWIFFVCTLCTILMLYYNSADCADHMWIDVLFNNVP